MKKQSGWGDNMQNTKEELYLAAILGEYSGELPLPNTKVECYLYKLAKDGVPGGSGCRRPAPSLYIGSCGLPSWILPAGAGELLHLGGLAGLKRIELILVARVGAR